MTNAERIRAMTDNELAGLLDQIANGGIEWFDTWQCNQCKKENNDHCPLVNDEDPCLKIEQEISNWLAAEN